MRRCARVKVITRRSGELGAVGSGQWAVGSGQWAVGSGNANKSELFQEVFVCKSRLFHYRLESSLFQISVMKWNRHAKGRLGWMFEDVMTSSNARNDEARAFKRAY